MTNAHPSEQPPSSEKWFGVVPCHWKTPRLATLFREVDRPADPQLPVLSVSIHSGVSDNELADEERDRKVNLSEDRSKYQRARPGDLVYNMMRAWQGAFGTVTVDGLVSPAYVVAEPKASLRTRFVELLLQTASGMEEVRRFSKGIADFRMRLYWEHFRDIVVCLPPIAEQDAILGYVDRECSRIDSLIEKKTSFLNLTRQRIAALVDEAISDSNLEWIRFGHVANQINRPAALSESSSFVRLGLFNRGRGIFHKPPADEQGMGDSSFYFVEEGDLIISGQFAWEGAVAMATVDESGCVVSHRYPVYRGANGVATEYLLAFLRSDLGTFILNDTSRGSAGRNRPLNTLRLEKEKLPIPSGAFQQRIANAIAFERQMKRLVDSSIELLKEHRSALITAAVTGKIDVRGLTNKNMKAAA